MKKKIPTFHTDKEAQNFVDTADLTEYDLSEFKPAVAIKIKTARGKGRSRSYPSKASRSILNRP